MADDQPYYGSWFLRVDRFADVHAVAAQCKGQTCGLASIKMAYFKVNKLRPQASSLTVERKLEALYKAKSGEASHDWNNRGAQDSIIVSVLNSMGIGNWAIEYPPLGQVGDKIAKYVGVDQFGLGITGINAALRGYPVLLGITWDGGGAGHWVVADTVTSIPLIGTYVTICDPWDADVHFEKIKSGSNFTYKPQKAIGINTWGTTQADTKGIGGSGFVDAIVYCQKSPGFWGK